MRVCVHACVYLYVCMYTYTYSTHVHTLIHFVVLKCLTLLTGKLVGLYSQ
uniref:Uncharacterized protein n=1 Tax=Anguilla anguilla TaxID=7936 RepID=A0A0E9VFX6_ANGAN